MNKADILVSGATGRTGGAAIDTLLEMGKCVRAYVRSDDERASALRQRGVDVAIGDFNELGNAAVSALAERLDIERTAMGKMAEFLERDGLVTIKPSPTDGRSRLIELTEKGNRLHKKAAPLWRVAQRQFRQLNGAKRVTALRRGLAEMTVGDVASGSPDQTD